MRQTRKEGLIMQLKAFINDIWGRAKNIRPSINATDKKTETPNSEMGEITELDFYEDSSGLFQKDGMSTAAARFIIERDVGERIGDLFDIKDLTNTGRYYIAKLVRPDGSVIERLLVDKQNCKIHFPRGKYS